MPIYEYACQACGHHVEKLQKLSDPALRDCPACGAPELRKCVSAAGFLLSGGGWYETDFKKPEQQKNVIKKTGENSGKSSDNGAA